MSAGEDLPVVTVSWFDMPCASATRCPDARGWPPSTSSTARRSRSSATRANRLPREAEWEHARCAGTTTPRYGDLDAIAWYADNSRERVHPVACRAPNAWGVHDMLGNGWEWCVDYYAAGVRRAPRAARRRVGRREWSCRAGVRRRSHPTFAVEDVSFRVVRSLSTTG